MVKTEILDLLQSRIPNAHDRLLLGVSWREHRTNKSILEELDVERELMAKVVKLRYSTLVMLQGEVPDS